MYIATLIAYIVLHNKHISPQQKKKIVIGSDNQRLLKRIKELQKLFTITARTSLSPEYEILQSIQLNLENLPRSELRYVKSKVIKDPTWLETLHNRCHNLAEHAHTRRVVHTTFCPSSGATLFIHTARKRYEESSANIAEDIRNAATSPELRSYFKEKYSWNERIIDVADWHIHHKVITNSKMINKKFLTQFLHQWLPLNGSPSTSSQSKLCPLCHEVPETPDHFLTCCSHPTVKKLLWTNCSTEIQTSAVRSKCDPVICQLICEVCSTQRQADVITRPESCTDKYDKLFHQQSRLGWKQLLQGRLSTEWVVMQSRYSQDTRYKTGSKDNTINNRHTALVCSPSLATEEFC